MNLQNYVILIGYRKDKVSEVRLCLNHLKEIERQIEYMASIDDKMTIVEELRVQSNGTTVYWQTHRVSGIRKDIGVDVSETNSIEG